MRPFLRLAAFALALAALAVVLLRPVAGVGPLSRRAARPGEPERAVPAPDPEVAADVRRDPQRDPRRRAGLVAEGTIRGRVLAPSGASAGAAVRLEPGVRTGRRFEPDPGAAWQATTDGEGRFRFDALEPGDYRIVARAADAVVAQEVMLRRGGNVDAGDLVLARGAAIRGSVLVPPGCAAAGLEVCLAPRETHETIVTDAEGRFRLTGLLAGEHELVLDAPGVLLPTRARVALAPGETRELVIDARANGACPVALAIALGGRPAAGLRVSLVPEPCDGGSSSVWGYELGRTDADGRISSFGRVLGSARVALELPSGARLLHPTPLGPFVQQVSFEAGVRFAVGTIEFELPPGLFLPSWGWIHVDLGTLGGSRWIALPPTGDAGNDRLDGRFVRCEEVQAGALEVTVTLSDVRRVSESATIVAASRREPEPLYRSSVPAVVRADTVTRVPLH